ncbi:MAG: AmmeMemoRadiSam system radical SAM enzyme [archaeon]
MEKGLMTEFMKEAMFYKELADDVVQCRLCNHFCAIKPGKRGICGVRENVSGKLFSLVYGKAVSEAVDPIEKKPLFHFLPGSLAYSVATAGCNFSCLFCQNSEISQAPKSGGKVVGYDLTPAEIVERAIDEGCRSIAYTYTEPTVFFEYAYDTAVIAHKKGLKNVFVSNGFMTTEAIDKILPYLDAINVDVKGSSEVFYKEVVGARLQPVLDNIRYLHDKGVWVEVTTLIVPGHNDDDKSLKKIGEFVASVDVNMPWHVSRFFPHFRMSDVAPTPVDVLKRAYRIGKKEGIKHIYVGNVPGSEYENTVCSKCGKVVVKRNGYYIESIDVKDGKCRFCGEKIEGVWK